MMRLLLTGLLLSFIQLSDVQAISNSQLRFAIHPLDCVSDIVDDGLNVHQASHTNNCGVLGAGHDRPETPSPDVVPDITIIGTSNEALTTPVKPVENRIPGPSTSQPLFNQAIPFGPIQIKIPDAIKITSAVLLLGLFIRILLLSLY